MRSRLALVVWFSAAALVPLWGDNKKAGDSREPDKKGEADDNNGNLAWRSTVAQKSASDSWDYAYLATNRSAERRCRIVWSFGEAKLKSVLPIAKSGHPTEKRLSAFSDEDKPKPLAGEIKYNGGAAPGDGKKDAPVWSPTFTGKAPKKSGAAAVLGIEDGDAFYEVAITGTPQLGTGQSERGGIQYELRVRPLAGSTPPPEAFVAWTVTEEKSVAAELRPVEEYNPKLEAFAVRLSGSPKEERVVRFAVPLVKEAKKKNAAVRILSPRDGRTVLAEAPLPALVPAP